MSCGSRVDTKGLANDWIFGGKRVTSFEEYPDAAFENQLN